MGVHLEIVAIVDSTVDPPNVPCEPTEQQAQVSSQAGGVGGAQGLGMGPLRFSESAGKNQVLGWRGEVRGATEGAARGAKAKQVSVGAGGTHVSTS